MTLSARDEASTRTDIIDTQLARAGWSRNRRTLIEEFLLKAAEPDSAYGNEQFADYVLLGSDGKPIAVVEAKRSARDELAGKRQAADYADAIKVKFGHDPFIFLTNGDDEKVHVRVFIHAETLWLPQRLMAELFQTTPDNIGLHLRNIYAEGELAEKATAEDFSVVQNEGGRAVRRILKHYSLDAIIAVGYRVNSRQATLFRIWATERLKEYIIKGFTMDDERLKNPARIFGEDYFEEPLASTYANQCEEGETAYLLDPIDIENVKLLVFDEVGKAAAWPGASDWEKLRVIETIQRLKLNEHTPLADERRKVWAKMSCTQAKEGGWNEQE